MENWIKEAAVSVDIYIKTFFECIWTRDAHKDLRVRDYKQIMTILIIYLFLLPVSLIPKPLPLKFDPCHIGECETFLSPCLASSDEFLCSDCELFGLEFPCPWWLEAYARWSNP
jgi:hypothetical protein